MPADDFRKILLWLGPIVIGQACEFTRYQACKAPEKKAMRWFLINSNLATIMTDSGNSRPQFGIGAAG